MQDVEAWEPKTGTALVVDPERGALRPVTDYSDFSHLEKANRVVSALPGGGWRAHWNDEGGAPLTEPILGWLVTSNGRAAPITVDATGWVETAELADKIIPPEEDLLDA
ncbi:hypothetical protein [Streptosporangium roseum]|uniref:hypothetical protein n=1 Tax=Streptosporangium roseum TaxID=2001 RepID=UPI00332DAFB7